MTVPAGPEASVETTSETASRARAAKRATGPDPVCAAAVDQARAAAEEFTAPGRVGDHLGVEAEDERVVSHAFACNDRAYRGWQWSVTIARAPRSKQPTVSEVVLLPGPEALQPPPWLPWSERLRPGDLGIGDLLPTDADDFRLAPGYADIESLEDEGALLEAPVMWELGLGRPRVLSREGRQDAAERWYGGAAGPTAPIAEVAPAQCSTCGFFAPMAGALGSAFGVCANEYAPDDGRAVSVDHGCGAHSEAAVVPATATVAPRVDDIGYDELSAPGSRRVVRNEQVEQVLESQDLSEVEVEDESESDARSDADADADAGAAADTGTGTDPHGTSTVAADEAPEELGHS